MINPSIVIQQQFEKASQLAVIMIRIAIHTSRANKFKKTDLRKLRAYPEKKARIRKIIWKNRLIARALLMNKIIISSQPIQRKSFAEGGEIAHIKYKNNE